MSKQILKTVSIPNKKASFEFALLERYTAGIVLTGTEIKSLRMGKANLVDAYCLFHEGELFVKNLSIATYDNGTHYNHEPLRDRKLLLQRRELRKLENKLKDKGLTIVPTRFYINENGFAKLDIALAKGKKNYDKRESIKERDVQRELDRR